MLEEFNLPKSEEKILEFWKTNDIFGKTIRQAQNKKHFVFFEGPPYANGKPGIHHVLARIYKDVILRYKTMRGYYVPRKAGWDTHGLPVEIAAEKALGLKSKKDIEKFGVKKFNEEAKKAVWVYKDEWERLTERIGYWLDLKNAYVTCEPEYIETLWWILAQIWKNPVKSHGDKETGKLLYKGHKVVPWCTRCGTTLSSHELALGYKEVEDNSVYVKFKLKKGQKIGKWTTGNKSYILSWTTTPWTLPGNVALAVGDKIQYVATEKDGDELWYAKESSLAEELGDVAKEVCGKDFVGIKYEPLFHVESLCSKNSYKIYDADFVTTTDGTGVVHTAVMYGEDDYKLGQEVGLPQHHTVDDAGKFTKEISGFGGLYVKDKKTEKKILDHLSSGGYLLATKPYAHEYPFCWRCDTPVLYYARNSWFIRMSKLRKELIDANKGVNWIPEHVKEGRFGEWLKEVKDWNLSRERYWGTPLPIWECEKCDNIEVVESLDELSEKALRHGSGQAGGSKNKYWTMRHGQSEANVSHTIDDGTKSGANLTLKGVAEAKNSAENFLKNLQKQGMKIDVIISSDVVRTRETEKLAAEVLGLKKPILDKRLEEIHLGALDGCHDKSYHKLFPTYESKFEGAPEGGETLRDMRKRSWEFLEDCESKYKGKNILIVSHEYTIWMLNHAAEGWSEKQAIREKEKRGDDFVETAEISKLNFRVVPRDDTGLVDIHKPFIDEIVFPCSKCKKTMKRVREVADVWYDSGAMPFASVHYPFAGATTDSKQLTTDEESNVGGQTLNILSYPADYIAEAMDQTRGWFYTLLAVATALGHEAPYKNVISLGLINDKNGQKMSKSKGNIVEPWGVINKHGADAVRWYFYTVNPPGETKNFDESEVQKSKRRMHMLLWNSLVFLETYANQASCVTGQVSKNILDRWMFARLEDAEQKITEKLDTYNIRDAALELEFLINDLSRWYIRRSRRRLQKPESEEDYKCAVSTMVLVISEIIKLIAPFTPFFAEILYKKLDASQKKFDSVHLEGWPTGEEEQGTRDEERGELLARMADVRSLASIALAKRAEAGIRVRQPLRELRIKNKELGKNKELLAILADEVNVKNVVFDSRLNLAGRDEVELDTVITPELKEEGTLRELARSVQELRQKAGLKPTDVIVVMLELPEALNGVVLRNEELLKKEVGAKLVEYKKGKFGAEAETKIDEENVWLAVRMV